MDLKFIKLMVESYYNDSQIVKSIYANKNEFINDIYTEIESIISSCRIEDKDVYLELYDLDKGKQQKILYTLIEQSLYDRYPDQFSFYISDYDKLYDIVINESLSGLAAGALGLGLSGLLLGIASQTTPVNKIKWSIMSKFQQINERIHKFITSLTKSGRVKTAIVFNNANECYQKCGIHDQNEISNFINGSLRNPGSSTDNILHLETTKGREQAHCLTTCYLKWSLNQVSVLLQSYLNCLRQTGQRGFDMNDIKSTLMTTPTSKICEPYFKLLKDHRKQFEEVLDVVCKNSIEREEFERLYDDTLNKAVMNSGKINSNPGYKLNKDSFSHRR